MNKSLLDLAFDYVTEKGEEANFSDIWDNVKAAAELSEEEAANKVSRFYTNLMLDGRFVTLGNNQWDLRSRHTFDKVHIDMKDVYNDVDEEKDTDDVEDAEEKEYNQVFEEKKEEDSENENEEQEGNNTSDTESEEF